MLRYRTWVSTIISVLLLTSLFAPSATARTPQAGPWLPADQAGLSQTKVEEGVHLLFSTSTGVTFEVNLPWEQLSVEPVTAGGKDYISVSIPGWSETAQAGAPALPSLTEQIGAPFGGSVVVRVVPGKAHIQVLNAPVLPVVTQKVEWGPPATGDGAPALPDPGFVIAEDPAVYKGEEDYPGALARVSSDGVLRQQRVVSIGVYPVQYHPKSMELTVYESLLIEVSFEGSFSTQPQALFSESDIYESLLGQELLNYDTARQWRQPAALPFMQLQSGTAGAALPWAPPAPGWRVKVRTDGFYKLTYTELLTAGLPVASLDPRTFQLYNLGNELAIFVEGEADGKFDQTDTVLFYGQALASKYTADNVYWLTYGKAQGLRMGTRDGAPTTAATPAYYSAQRHMEANAYYFPFAPGDENMERWMWDYVYPPSRPNWTYPFTVAQPYAGAGTLKVAMLGYLNNPINPDHHVRISLNGTQVGDFTWDGITWQIVEMNIPQSILAVGSNTLEVMDPNDTGVGSDVVYIDWAELDFPNTFLAENNELGFTELSFTYTTPGTWKYQVEGFTTNLMNVYDVSNPAAPVRFTNLGVTGSGPYSAVFQDMITASTHYWATTGYRTVQTKDIEIDTASSLESTANAADHIVISHHDFLTAATTLRNFRASQGLRAVKVDVQDVYDEFGYGIEGAAPIHDFLAYAYAYWQKPAPSYVVLVGDGNYDPKNYLGNGSVSYMPPYLAPVDPWIGETAADNRYVTLTGNDTFPDMMLGRLSVNSAAEADVFVNKIVAYEQTPVPGDWQKQVLLVADNADNAGNFAQFSDDLLNCCLSTPYQAEKVYYGVTHLTVTEAQTAILTSFNAGKLIVNYIGHGSITAWSSEPLFKASDVAGLTNGGRLPVVLPMTCYDGYFIYPTSTQATAEVVTNAAGKGAVASWSPTGLGVSSGHDYLDRGFFHALFQDGKATVGLAIAAGKLNLFSTGSNLDLLDTYLLFGDPALHIPLIPTGVNLNIHLPLVLK
jgi:hypothetical protein